MIRKSRFGGRLEGTNGAIRARLCRLREVMGFGRLMLRCRVERIILLRGRAVSSSLSAQKLVTFANDLEYSLPIGSSKEPNDSHCRLQHADRLRDAVHHG